MAPIRQVKYLGIVIDDVDSFIAHIKEVARKENDRINKVARIKLNVGSPKSQKSRTTHRVNSLYSALCGITVKRGDERQMLHGNYGIHTKISDTEARHQHTE